MVASGEFHSVGQGRDTGARYKRLIDGPPAAFQSKALSPARTMRDRHVLLLPPVLSLPASQQSHALAVGVLTLETIIYDNRDTIGSRELVYIFSFSF